MTKAAAKKATTKTTKTTPKRSTASSVAEIAAAPAPAATSNGASAPRPTSSAAAEKAVPRLVVTEASIRQQAYFLSLRRKGSDPVADWLDAERILRAQAE